MRHQPGEADEAVRLVASWSDADVRTLRIDINVVEQIMRGPGSAGPVFEFTIPGQSKPTLTRYVGDQYRRMADLACAAGGYVVGSTAVPRNLAGMCFEIKATDALDADLRRLAVASDDARIRGDHDNYILRRGALLHADIAMLVLRPGEPHTADGTGAPDAGVTLAISDGEGTPDVRPIAIHWAVARMLLDDVVPPGAVTVAPGHDDMVRQWYRATATWMQQAQQYQTEHLNHARALFAQDADILFLSGWAHETYAGPAIQSAVQSASLPAGVVLDVASDRNELRAAEGFFRGALAARPAFGEAHLRLGRVLLLRGRAGDAVVELQQATAPAGCAAPVLRATVPGRGAGGNGPVRSCARVIREGRSAEPSRAVAAIGLKCACAARGRSRRRAPRAAGRVRVAGGPGGQRRA